MSADAGEERDVDMLAELQRLYRAYVSLLESGRDRIVERGGTCDAVDVMEAGDPALVAARAAITAYTSGRLQENEMNNELAPGDDAPRGEPLK